MKTLAVLTAATVATVALAGPALAAPAQKPAYSKIVEEKFLGFGTGKYTLNGQPLVLAEKPWWYSWTPDTQFNSGLTSDNFKAVLAANPGALANAQGRDGIRTIGMIANIGARGVGLVSALGLVGVGGIQNAQVALVTVIGLVGTGILVDFGTEVLTWGSLERSVEMYNQGAAPGASLHNWSAAQPRADVQVGLFQASF